MKMEMKTTKETYVKPELDILSLELETPLLNFSTGTSDPQPGDDPTGENEQW